MVLFETLVHFVQLRCVVLLVTLLCLGSRSVICADTELVKHQKEAGVLQKALGIQVSHSGQFPPTYLRISTDMNPLRDEPNLSSPKVKARDEDRAIQGSKKAYVITKLSYLKKEWCKTEPVKQVIRKQGCVKKTIINRFCYGQCNSFFIPRRRGRDMEENAFRSCAFCRPKKTAPIRVTLNCPGRAIRQVRKKVKVIKSCSCMALNLN